MRLLNRMSAKLIGMICYYASGMNEPSLNDSKMLYFYMYKTHIIAECCKVPFVRQGPNILSTNHFIHCKVHILVNILLDKKVSAQNPTAISQVASYSRHERLFLVQ